MSKNVYDSVLEALDNAGASMRCGELANLLASLGFEVRDGKRGGHKIFTHDGLPEFRSGSYNCDHGRNPEIKRPYINKVSKTLKKYEDAIRSFLKK